MSDDASDRTQNEEFCNLCAQLKSNDPTVTGVVGDNGQWPMGCAEELGKSIVHNTVVSEIRLGINDLVDFPWGEDITEAEAAHRYYPACYKAAEPLLQYLRTSQTLCYVVLRWGDTPDHLINDIISGCVTSAIAENSTIEHLEIGLVLPMPHFVNLFATTQSLKHLYLFLDDYHRDLNDDDKQLVIEALGSNETLERIELSHSERETAPLVDTLMLRLSSHVRLESLELRTWGFHLPDSIPIILSSTPTNFRRFVIGGYRLTKDSLTKLTEAVRSNSSIEQLGMEACMFDRMATKTVREMLLPQEGNAELARPLDLTLGSTCRCFDAKTMFNGVSLTKFLRDLPVPDKQYAKRACLEKSPTRLSSVSLSTASSPDAENLAAWLPHSADIRHLKISHMSRCDSDLMLGALRRNGSLHCVSIERNVQRHGEIHPPYFTPSELRLVQALCDRNQHAPLVLAAQRPESSDSLLVTPLVFTAVQPVWKTAPNTMLIGLMSPAAAGPAIGPSQVSFKRVEPELS